MALNHDDTGQHKTSLAVWDLPSPLVIGRPAKMKIGAKCSAGCRLTDHEIEIHDQANRNIARARLGAAPWSGTTGLYWAELDFSAPATAGTHTWSVASVHGDGFSNFTFITVPPPDHNLTICVREKVTQNLLPDVEVRLGVYRASSNDGGLAKIELPTGTYTLNVWKIGYEYFSMPLNVTATLTVDVEIAVEPDPKQPYWM